MRNHPDALEWNKTRDVAKYAEYMRNQVRELLTEFGKIDIIWFDFSYPTNEHLGMKGKGRDDWQSAALLKMVRELQPGIIVDNRLDLPGKDGADIHTPEQYQPTEWVKVDGEPMVWEACQTLSGSWGYHRDEMTWKSPEQLIRMLISTVACGGNLLMNVGPTARGTLDDRALRALGVYRDWMRLHARSIYVCTQSEFTAPADVRYTQNGNRLYVHIYAWPFQQLHLPGLAGKVEYCQLLNDASEVAFKEVGETPAWNEPAQMAGTLTLNLPVVQPDVVVPVVELFLKS
jgi:alpha-L-fucosidase